MRKPIKLLLTLFISIFSITMFGGVNAGLTQQQKEDPNASSKQEGSQATPQQDESQATPQGQTSGHMGVQSVTGCVMKGDHGYSLKTDNATYDIDTDSDLSQYVGKQVRISGVWEHHKATTRTPTDQSGSSASAGAAQGEHQAPSSDTNPVVARDIRLRTVTSVVGDCPSQ